MTRNITKLLLFVTTLVASMGLFALLYLFLGFTAFDAGILPVACIVFSVVAVSIPDSDDD